MQGIVRNYEHAVSVVGREAANELRMLGLLVPDFPHVNAEMYRVDVLVDHERVRDNDLVSMNKRLCRDFEMVWLHQYYLATGRQAWSSPYYMEPISTASKLYRAKGPAKSQYNRAIESGLLAWFVPVGLVPDKTQIETNYVP